MSSSLSKTKLVGVFVKEDSVQEDKKEEVFNTNDFRGWEVKRKESSGCSHPTACLFRADKKKGTKASCLTFGVLRKDRTRSHHDTISQEEPLYKKKLFVSGPILTKPFHGLDRRAFLRTSKRQERYQSKHCVEHFSHGRKNVLSMFPIH